MKKFLVILCGLFCLTAWAAEVIPPVPAQYLNDYAGVVSITTSAHLNQRLEQFERDASSQIVIAIYPTMQSDSSIEDYTARVAESWKVGQKDKNNGAVLFVFTQDHKMFLQVGYGLEGALPDVTCKRIVEDEIKPYFKIGDYDGGLTTAVNSILAAVKGEYKGTGKTVGDRHLTGGTQDGGFPFTLFVIIVVILGMYFTSKLRSGGYYSRSGWSSNSWGGGSWGGFSSGGGGGGGFSGGGGSFGGGGAGGSW